SAKNACTASGASSQPSTWWPRAASQRMSRLLPASGTNTGAPSATPSARQRFPSRGTPASRWHPVGPSRQRAPQQSRPVACFRGGTWGCTPRPCAAAAGYDALFDVEPIDLLPAARQQAAAGRTRTQVGVQVLERQGHGALAAVDLQLL